MTGPFIHPTAIVDDGASIGVGTKIWHFSHVSSGAIIGAGCVVGQNVYVAGSVTIGSRVRIQNNVSVYDAVTIEDEVFCGPSAVFTNVFNPRSGVSRKAEYRPTLVRTGATLGANCTVVCGVTIGRYAFVAAGAVVTKDVGEHSLVMGVPARHCGWMSRNGQRLALPVSGSGVANCSESGEQYLLQGDHCTLMSAP